MWNAGSTPARMIEVISPAGFEHFFRELATPSPPDRRGSRTLGPLRTSTACGSAGRTGCQA
jgi:hypothetical protein